MEDTTRADAYAQLIALLDQHGAHYRLIDHLPEGRTDVVSQLRGNAVEQAAKCIVLMVKLGKKITKYILAVVPGNARIDLDAVKSLVKGTYVAFASPLVAEKLTGCVSGTILPISFNSELLLIVDPAVLQQDELYFNAARLDRSVVLRAADYASLTQPRVERIVARFESQPK